MSITGGTKNYKSIINKKKKKHGKIVLLAKSELNSIEDVISKVLVDSYNSHDELVLVNSLLKQYDDIKKEINTQSKILVYSNVILLFEV